MQASDLPTRVQLPFANAGTKATVPVLASGVPGRASFTEGFPDITMQPIASGGIPPAGQDFNGLLFAISAWSRWQSAGGTVPWNSAYSTAIGGYPAGAVVASTVTVGLQWLSTTDNNTTNPDSGGAGWISYSGGRLLNLQTFSTSGTYTPTPGMRSCYVRAVGGGAAGGGGSAPSTGNVSMGGPGGAGTYAEFRFTAADIGASKAVTIGAGGTGNAGGTGGVGTATVLATLLSCPGGVAGSPLNDQAPPSVNGNGSASGAVTGSAIFAKRGGGGLPSFGQSATSGIGGAGGDSPFGTGGNSVGFNSNGANATGFGAGGGGTCIGSGGGTSTGGNGFAGFMLIEEYS